MIKYSKILIIMLYLILFKSLLLIFIPNILINLGIFFILFFVSFMLMIYMPKSTSINLLLIGIIMFISILVPISLLVDNIHPKLVLYAYLRILFVLLIVYIAFNIQLITLRKVVKKLSKIIYFYILVGFVEFLIPVVIKKPIITWFVLRKSGSEVTSLNMYYFKEFGQEIFRLGSIAFEPITFSMISAIGIYLLLKQHRKKLKIFFYSIITLVTFAKSGIVTLLMVYNARFCKKYFLPFTYSFIFIILIVFFLLFGDIVINLIQSDKSYEYIKVFITHFATVGNHIIGLIMGIVGGFEKPLLGHGLGTAGYIISTEAIKLGMEGPTILNGNESTIGTLVYQIGFFGTMLIMIIFSILIKMAKKNKDYLTIGLIVGFVIFIFLSESAFAMAIVTSMMFAVIYMLRIENFTRKKKYENSYN